MTDIHHVKAAPFDKPARVLLALVAVPLGLSALLGLAVGLQPTWFNISEPLWMLAAFEAVTLFSAAIALLTALGRFREGPGITVICIAGSIAISAVLASLSANNNAGGTDLMPFVLARLAAAGLVALSAAAITLQSRAALIKLITGAILLAPIAAAGAIFVTGRAASFTDRLDSLGPTGSLIVAILAGFAGLVAVSAGGHLVITAFEPHRDPNLSKADQSPRPMKPTPAKSE